MKSSKLKLEGKAQLNSLHAKTQCVEMICESIDILFFPSFNDRVEYAGNGTWIY